jgi:imidazoleglycerol phosphate synthase glutamine amidotransferase subunit HisH
VGTGVIHKKPVGVHLLCLSNIKNGSQVYFVPEYKLHAIFKGILQVAGQGQSLMRAAMSQLNLSACAYHRTRSVKLAQTITDLAEALQYKPKIMMGQGASIVCIWK